MASPLRFTDRSTPSRQLPNRLNEMWREGRPHIYAKQLAERLQQETPSGSITCDAPAHCLKELNAEDKARFASILTNGSQALVTEHLKHFGSGISLIITETLSTPIKLHYESAGLFTPCTQIHLKAGAKAHIIETHIGTGKSLIFSLRFITIEQGAELTIELHEQGSGESRCMNISDILIDRAKLTHYSEHKAHEWAREETGVRLFNEDAEAGECDVKLLSANHLSGTQVLDQRTNQDHMSGFTVSDLIYKNVIDDKAKAIFDGNIMVAEKAHHSDAYLHNHNLMLSKNASVNSLPRLEILADKVRCSHGSASGPLNEEALFYLCARGIAKYEAQLLVAEGFLEDVHKLLPQQN